jgi:hypothetical protein
LGTSCYVVAAEVRPDGTRGVSLCYPHGRGIAGTWVPPEKVPAIAALCLHGRLTWEMVDELRRYCTITCDHDEAALFAIADLLESLLPPREPKP